MRVTSLGVCLKVIEYEKTLNLEKTTSSVLSILLLIYGQQAKKLADIFGKETEHILEYES